MYNHTRSDSGGDRLHVARFPRDAGCIDFARLRGSSQNPTASPHELNVHEDAVVSAVISEDSRWLVTGSHDKTAMLWDLRAEPPSCIVLRGHEDWVTQVAIDADWMVTGSADQTARLWDLDAEDPSASSIVLPGHTATIVSVAIGPNGHWLATGSTDRTARLWDLTAADPAHSSRVLWGHDAEVYCVAITHDWVVTGSRDHTARLWDLAAEDPSASSVVLRGHEETISRVVTGGPGGNVLVTASWDGTARIWDLASPNPASLLFLPDYVETEATGAAISADSGKLVTQSSDNTLRLFDLANIARTPVPSRLVLSGHVARNSVVALSPDGHSVITGDAQGIAQLFDLTDSGASLRRRFQKDDERLLSVLISPNNRWLVTRNLSGVVRLWDTHDPMAAPRELPGYFAAGARWGTPMAINEHWLVTASLDQSSQLWDLTASDPTSASRALPRHENSIISVAISPNGRWLATTSYDGTARLWNLTLDDPATGWVELEHRDHLLQQSFSRGVLSSAFSPDNRLLVTGGADGLVRRWDLFADDVASSAVDMGGHTAAVLCVVVSSDKVVTASEDSTARVWDLTADDPGASSLVLRGHEATVDAVAISPDSRWVVTTSADGTLRLWDLDIDSVIERARLLAGRELTSEEKIRFAVPAQ